MKNTKVHFVRLKSKYDGVFSHLHWFTSEYAQESFIRNNDGENNNVKHLYVTNKSFNFRYCSCRKEWFIKTYGK